MRSSETQPRGCRGPGRRAQNGASRGLCRESAGTYQTGPSPSSQLGFPRAQRIRPLTLSSWWGGRRHFRIKTYRAYWGRAEGAGIQVGRGIQAWRVTGQRDMGQREMGVERHRGGGAEKDRRGKIWGQRDTVQKEMEEEGYREGQREIRAEVYGGGKRREQGYRGRGSSETRP